MPNDENWESYFEKTAYNPPRELVKKAMALFQMDNHIGNVIDIGCVAGNDVLFLLEHQWHVLAIDREISSQNFIQQRFENHPNLEFQLADFQKMKLKPVEWVNCSFVLPFCEADYFDTFMKYIQSNILSKGRFSGNFFGMNHGWNHLNLLSKDTILDYFKDFEIEFLSEIEENRVSALGEPVYFHNIDVIAKKK